MFADPRELFGHEARTSFRVESLDVSPLQPDHVMGKLYMRFDVLGMIVEPGFQTRAQVAQRERLLWAVGEIFPGQPVELRAAENRLQAREIFFE